MNFKEDRPWLRILVLALFLVETAQSAIIARDLFEIHAKRWGDPAAVFSQETQWLSAPIMDSISQ